RRPTPPQTNTTADQHHRRPTPPQTNTTADQHHRRGPTSGEAAVRAPASRPRASADPQRR
ncbi:hypothetical protein, partial [Streptomyces sp. 8K308]|uniref:hypothetical protein n=1 Tax=Streptomyces sp. 8K308 TaxID=2530388 RepID=UPI001A9D3119